MHVRDFLCTFAEKIIHGIMAATVNVMSSEASASMLNPAQLHLLRMFSYMKSEAQLMALKKVLSDYYFNEVEKGMSDLESQGLWGREQSDAVMNEHLRTAYI